MAFFKVFKTITIHHRHHREFSSVVIANEAWTTISAI